MDLKKIVLGLSVAAIVFTHFPSASQAAEIKQGMTQGQFALAIVEKVGALPHLPPAASEEDAIRFLTKLGLVPCTDEDKSQCGWNAAEPIDAKFLAALLGLSDEESKAALSDPNAFEKLLDRVLDLLNSSFNNLNTGVSAAGAPASGSGVA